MISINNKSWDKVNAKDIKKVLSGDDDETLFFEFKSDDEEPNKLVKEISALSNTYGGYLFLGVNNDKSIGGCQKWTEQRIHTTIHDSLTPPPIFDVRKFKINGKTIFVIRVEEGPLPPYVTSKGAIYERVSSGSFPIKDSARLTQLYNKRNDQEVRVRKKIEFGDIGAKGDLPSNLCAYIDGGFSVTCSESTYLQKNFYNLDLSEALKDVAGTNMFSFSRVGTALMITFGQLAQSNSGTTTYLPPVGLHNYMIIYADCSVSYRFLLFSSEDDNRVDISVLPILTEVFVDIFKLLCGTDFARIFVHAQKYEALKVFKQFVPAYDIERHYKISEEINPFRDVLQNHQQKYGENLIVQSNRVPFFGYDLIDKQWFSKYKIKYNQEELIHELFHTSYVHLGYVDPLEVKK